jgi:Mrp family chromosome partitioning ATPase
MLGLYGQGKTTTIAKLASYYAKRGNKVCAIGLDVHRPAASEQLKQLCDKLNIPVFINPKEKDPKKTWADAKIFKTFKLSDIWDRWERADLRWKEKAKEEKITGLDTVLMQAYEKLVAAIPSGVSVADIMSIVTMYVPNTSAFSLRMNTMLSKKGNPYRMIRVKNNNIPHYLFTPFNKVD